MIRSPRMVVIFGVLVIRRLRGSIPCLAPPFPTTRRGLPWLPSARKLEVRDAPPMAPPLAAPTPVASNSVLWVDLIHWAKTSPDQDFKSHLVLNGPQ